ncbi:uncharacterized protein LY89DRAFT_372318 [Mollisia scopiformis]|uniref:Uncharacterized protein n=1 Tax=Mollisia scopiformis TaxID=149040 RepID=A0A132B3D6_MOLSC|nr:uncharacterized protein LY89DRAFT_372318 [Mollisia scopiformis]KUJ06918.1 hypothetical protein LY89DRAFT_372318 [Mollisia scopiformis]
MLRRLPVKMLGKCFSALYLAGNPHETSHTIKMAPNSNTSSLENLNGSVRSTHSNHTYHSIGLARTTMSRAAGSAHTHANRHHTYPAPVAREYHYADNSAAGHNLYHSNRNFNQTAVMYQEPAPLNQLYTNQTPTRSQTYLLPAATYTMETYDSEISLDEEPDNNTETVPSQPEGSVSDTEQMSIADGSQSSWNATYGIYEHNDTEYSPSRSNTDHGDGEDEYYVEQPDTPPERETYSTRPHSPTTQRYLQEDSPQERIVLGLPRQSRREERRAYERSIRRGASRRETTRRR